MNMWFIQYIIYFVHFVLCDGKDNELITTFVTL